MILYDSAAQFSIDSQISLELILILANKSKDWFSLILNDSQWFSMILTNSQWFSLILDDSWWFLNKSGIDSQISLKTDSHWFSLILDDSWWFSSKSGIDSQIILDWFSMILTNS